VKEMFCNRRHFVKEDFCYGNVLLRRFFVWRRFVGEAFMCVEMTNFTVVCGGTGLEPRPAV
jgi:hypothetical protein